MSQFIGAYIERAKQLTSYWGNWPVSQPIRVGTIGIIGSDGQLVPISHLSERPGIPEAPAVEDYKTNVNDSHSYGVQHSLKPAVQVDAGIPGVPAASVEVAMNFTRSGSTFIAYHQATFSRFEDLPKVERQVLSLWEAREQDSNAWNKKWLLVTHTMSATGVTVLLSKQANTQFVVSMDMPVLELFQLADPNIDMSINFTGVFASKVVAEKATPLFQAVRIRKEWFRPPGLELVKVNDKVIRDAFEDPPLGTKAQATSGDANVR
jgi:hypothetical protein